jgi:hypothetical protein
LAPSAARRISEVADMMPASRSVTCLVISTLARIISTLARISSRTMPLGSSPWPPLLRRAGSIVTYIGTASLQTARPASTGSRR